MNKATAKNPHKPGLLVLPQMLLTSFATHKLLQSIKMKYVKKEL